MDAERTEQELQRRHKVQALRSQGIEPYQSRFDRTHSSADASALFEQVEKAGPPDARTERVALAGRLVALRVMGKATFAHLQDHAGRIQLLAKVDKLGEDAYRRFTDLDLGDLIGVHGTLFRTKRGEITCEIEHFVLLAKALRPLPEKYHGLKDKELRFRQRYLDLIANPEVMEVFLARSRLVEETRTFLKGRGFVEVETPVLQSMAGGAAARPFRTHHNALDMELYLRIALELYLKRLIIGGFDRVFEIGRIFRNEGMDQWHSPEYTMLELYQAYTDVEGMMELTESLVVHLVERIKGTPSLRYQGDEIQITRPFKRIEMAEAVSEVVGQDVLRADVAQLGALIKKHDIEPKPGLEWGGLIAELFEELVQDRLVQPTFVLGHPVEVSPLARRRTSDPRLTDRFELFIAKEEIANAFSELNDPDDQRARFEDQARARAAGDEETHPMDEDFLTALEHGFPPTGGMGMGIDRLAAIITDQPSIRDVILFPHLRARHAEP
jgi:lysyl-tRNA synthetase, class II